MEKGTRNPIDEDCVQRVKNPWTKNDCVQRRCGSFKTTRRAPLFHKRYCWWFRNPVNSPVEVGSLSRYLQGFSTIPGGCLGFEPSTVWYTSVVILSQSFFLDIPTFINWGRFSFSSLKKLVTQIWSGETLKALQFMSHFFQLKKKWLNSSNGVMAI